VIESLTGQGIDVSHACRVLGVSPTGYYDWETCPRVGKVTSLDRVRRDFRRDAPDRLVDD
jgi:hypothetical protein